MMSKYINTEDLHKVVLKRKAEYGSLADLIDNIVEGMVKETPYANVVEKEKYEMLQIENRGLHKSCDKVNELEKLNGNLREMVNKTITEMEDESINFAYKENKTLGASYGLRKAIDILKKNLGE